jgi:hypothetical protein
LPDAGRSGSRVVGRRIEKPAVVPGYNIPGLLLQHLYVLLQLVDDRVLLLDELLLVVVDPVLLKLRPH